jgi:hypothetical protein
MVFEADETTIDAPRTPAGRRGRAARWPLVTGAMAAGRRAAGAVEVWGAEERAFIIERLLREREAVCRQIAHEQRLDRLAREMLATSAIGLAVYGAIMGVSFGPAQALSSALKLPLLYLLTLAICLPTFYLFNLFCGGRLSARQVVALTLAAITIMAALTVAFAPISVFFLVTARDYEFFKLLNVAILTLTGVAGLSFLVAGIRRFSALAAEADAPSEDDPDAIPATTASRPSQPVSMPLLWSWLLLFGFVGAQLGWTLRPFFGSPLLDFQLFRPLEGNFYTHIAQTIADLLR